MAPNTDPYFASHRTRTNHRPEPEARPTEPAAPARDVSLPAGALR